jgi:hypothetical protein
VQTETEGDYGHTVKERAATASRVMNVNKKEVLFCYLREAQSNQDEEEEDIM